MSNLTDTESYRDSIATVNEDGKRNWIYPKRPKGRYYQWRTYLTWVFLIILFGLPFIKHNGEPLVLLNILERKFIIFGLHFTPQDFHLFAILMITGVVFITLFTAIFGRLFCGWVCPQTIFMEMVFRKVEYWIEGDANAQRRLNNAPWTREKMLKKGAKQLIFIAISVLIAHTFLAYIIGLDAVVEIVSQPPSHDWMGFIAIVLFIGAFYFVFAYLREQVCIAICPYGRLQGVLLDNNSINVMYDWIRGEPRGKLKKEKTAQPKSDCQNCPNCRDGKDSCSTDVLKKMEEAVLAYEATTLVATPALEIKGDCIDCGLCVQVCPTGIDIRNGVQLECINCTACIDACDEVMDKINKPRGLIRYDSTVGVEKKERKLLTPRVLAYSAVLLSLIVVNIVLLSNRGDVNIILMRTPGLLYQKNDDGSVNNLYKFQLVNKTNRDIPLEFRLPEGEAGQIRLVGDPIVSQPGEVTEGALFIDRPVLKSSDGNEKVPIEVWAEGKVIKRFKTSFITPIQ